MPPKNSFVLFHIQYAKLKINTYIDYLSNNEKEKLKHIKNDLQKNRYIVRQLLIKYLISQWLNCPLNSIEICKHPSGKPYIKKPKTSLSFNTTFTKTDCFFIINDKTYLGIDAENIKKNLNFLKIAKKFFFKEEYDYLYAHKHCTFLLEQHFLKMWTRKESIIKCYGKKISTQLRLINNSHLPWIKIQTKELLPELHLQTLIFNNKRLNNVLSIASTQPIQTLHYHSFNSLNIEIPLNLIWHKVALNDKLYARAYPLNL